MTLTFLEPVPPLGKELAAHLVAAFPEHRRRLVHTQSGHEHIFVELAGEAAVVSALGDLDELHGASVLVVCGPPAPGRVAGLVAWLRDHPEVRLLDCSRPGISPGETTCVVGTSLPDGVPRHWYCLPDPAISGPAHVLGALAPLDPDLVHLTVLSPVSGLGEDAVAELAAQGAARLSGVTPPRPRSLPRVLAFDLAPSAPTRVQLLEAQLATLHPGLGCHVWAIDAGVFFGHSAVLQVHCQARLRERQVRALLHGTPLVRLARRGEGLAPSDLVDENHIAVGELRVHRDWLSAWLAWDGTRVGGSHTAVELLREIMAALPTAH